MLAQPIAGLVSDRTRSKFGRRAPWMVGGTLVGGLALIGMGAANTLVQLAIAWIIVQVVYNFAQGPLSAILPDRVPNSARGAFSAFAGLGSMLGALGGQIVGAQFATAIPAGYLVFGGFALVVTVLFVVLNPDKSNKGEPKPPFNFTDVPQDVLGQPAQAPGLLLGLHRPTASLRRLLHGHRIPAVHPAGLHRSRATRPSRSSRCSASPASSASSSRP